MPTDRTDRDEKELRALLETFAEGWNAGSGADVARAFAPDADFTNVMGLRARGRETIARGHDEVLATVFRGTRLTTAVERMRFPRPDVAVVDGRLALERSDGGPLEAPGESRVIFVATREAEGWSIASFVNMIPFVRPAAGPVERSLAGTRDEAPLP